MNASIVLADFGPSSGVINKVFLLSCDYILPPAFADYFSLSSVHGLVQYLFPEWISWHQTLCRAMESWISQDPDLEPWRFNRHFPRILPLLVTSYDMYARRNVVTKASSGWILELEVMLNSAPPSVQVL